MKTLLSLIVLLLLLCSAASAQEVQIAFDSAGKVMVITEEMEKNLHLFPSYPHFHDARLFQRNDTAYFLEITSTDDGKNTRNWEPKTKDDILLFRRVFMNEAPPPITEHRALSSFDQSSRSKFLVWETLLSVFGYGPLLISTSNSGDAAVTTGIELVVGGLGYIIPYVLTKNAPMTDGEASLALGGAFDGGIHGVLLDLLIQNGEPGRELGAITTIASVGETGLGYYLARKYNFSEGKSDIIRYGGFFGAGDGALVALAATSDPSTSFVAGASLLGSAAGFVAGTAMTNSQQYTRGNASVVLTAGIFGGYLTSLLYSTALGNDLNSSSARGLALSALVGNVGSVLLGHYLMHGKSLSTGEGNDVILGTSAGWLVGTGLGYIVSSKSARNDLNGWSITIPSVICTAAGFTVMVLAIGQGSGDNKDDTGWKMDFNPGALMGALIAPKQTPSQYAYIPPAFSLQYRW
ncbi:MAG: hypothetical protein Q8916_08315 [Bacteroidota bacterium]|nr:hypothetical protein [Bacteroidota bacterium]MDP4230389.1 hypothetical protein [Bacteroidota bacterium]MDP4235827.1 hypothetical protein [Bacteroidota bacterium]